MGAGFASIWPISIRSAFTDRFVSSTGTLGDARACSDGTKPLQMVALYGYLSGKGAARSYEIYAGGSSTTSTVAASGQAEDTGYLSSNVWNSFAGNGITYGYAGLSGECYFGRSPGGGGSVTPYSTVAGNLAMSYEFFQCQSAPTSLAVTPAGDGASAVLTWGIPSDDGGTARTGYRVQVASNATFTTGLSTIDVSSSATGVTVTGLTPGSTYYFRITARNAVTDAATKLGGVWSAGVSAVMPLQPFNGTIYESGVFREAKVERYNGTSWDADVTALTYRGGVWEPVG